MSTSPWDHLYIDAERRDTMYGGHIDRARRSINLANMRAIVSLSVGSINGAYPKRIFRIKRSEDRYDMIYLLRRLRHAKNVIRIEQITSKEENI